MKQHLVIMYLIIQINTIHNQREYLYREEKLLDPGA